MSGPSDGMTMDELRDEFDWMYEFMGSMAERTCGDADVHNLVDYVRKLESENARLRELLRDAWGSGHPSKSCGECEILDECHEYLKTALPFSRCLFEKRIEERMRELGVDE